MRSDLDRLMEEANIDALWVSGNLFNNPDMVYLTGIHHVNQADLFKLKNRGAILFHHVDMEREEAAKTGLETQPYFAETPLADYIQKADGDVPLAIAMRIREAMQSFGLTSGAVAISGQVDMAAQHAILEKLKTLVPQIKFTSFYKDNPFLTARMTKDAEEIAHIRAMGKLTTEVIGRVQRFLQACDVKETQLRREDGSPLTVRDVKSRINLWLAELGAENPEDTIFAIGRDGGIPHSSGNPDDVITLGQAIVFDIFPCQAGGGYFYDMTRTWCLGYAPQAVQDLYQQVLDVHHHLIDNLIPNTPFKDYQAMTCEMFAAQGHVTIAQDRTTREGYLHSIGHGLGLNVHEKPFSGLTAAADDRLVPGVVFTIEPGLYYPERGMGVRIEDTIYLNEQGQFEIIAEYPYDLVIPVG
jgi:Xaa-Pro aminopeptidase